MKQSFKKCAACACSSAGSFGVAHLGCVISPMIMAAMGIGAAFSTPFIAIAFGAAAVAGGAYAWHKIRGPVAGKGEKRIFYASAVAGFVLSAAFHLAAHRNVHAADDKSPEPVMCGVPQRPSPK